MRPLQYFQRHLTPNGERDNWSTSSYALKPSATDKVYLHSIPDHAGCYASESSVVWSLTASMSLASSLSSTSRKTSVSVAHETGCLPLPLIHSSSISKLICSASPRCLYSMLRILVPLVSSKSRMPNWGYLVLISWGMLILLSLPRNLTSSIRVGCSSIKYKWDENASWNRV